MKTKILFIVPSIIIFLAGMMVLRVKSNRPPVDLVLTAGKALTEAKLEKSPRYAEMAFREATMYYSAAMTEWKRQNERMFLLRDYKQVSELARRSAEKSRFAIQVAKTNISGTKELLEIRIVGIGEKLNEFDANFGMYPQDKTDRKNLAKNKIVYSESLQAFQNNNYSECKSKLDSVEIFLDDLISAYRADLKCYFENYSAWLEMVRQTISDTENSRSVAVVVDKFNRELSVYKNGKKYRAYRVELGTNWVGDKMQQGDKSTPEGMYRVVGKKRPGQTKYHKALLLNYPNEEDKQRFSLNKKNGAIDAKSKIGNLIEIHGNGGKGADWTDGCIALINADMDELFGICQVGTKVTIVGSTKTLEELNISTQ